MKRLVRLVAVTKLQVPLRAQFGPEESDQLSTASPQAIASTKKKIAERDVEQISFKMTGAEAELKRRFVELLQPRGIGIREALIDFIELFVKLRGRLGVVPLRGRPPAKRAGYSTVFPQNKASPAQNSCGEECHNQLDIILDYASERVREVITETLAIFAEMALQDNVQRGIAQEEASKADESDQATIERARDVIRRANQLGSENKSRRVPHSKQERNLA